MSARQILDELLSELHTGTTKVMLQEVKAYLGEADGDKKEVSPQLVGKIIEWMKYNNYDVPSEVDENMANLELDFKSFEDTLGKTAQ